tara:strand:- start:1759 stop:1872 length:114 start_codon:yes stop_codon:yes gene_type:complete
MLQSYKFENKKQNPTTRKPTNNYSLYLQPLKNHKQKA